MGGGTGGGDPAIRCGHAIRINPGCKQVTTRNREMWNVQKVDLRPTLLIERATCLETGKMKGVILVVRNDANR